MKKLKIVMAAVGILLLLGSVLTGCSESEIKGVKVVTTTSLLGQIVERIGGDKVHAVNIIPPSQCPGHFDVKPGDIQMLSDAPLFLMHGWQGEMFTDELVASANNPDLLTVVINAKAGENVNWMAPPVQKDGVDKVVAALSQVDSENSEFYKESADKYKTEVDEKAAELQVIITETNFADIKVICNEKLTGLVRWMGLDVIKTYGRPDELTSQIIRELVDTARAEGVVLFIDNLQAGADSAVQMANEAGCEQITFTNFPGGFDGTETWAKAIQYDVDLILEAISQ